MYPLKTVVKAATPIGLANILSRRILEDARISEWFGSHRLAGVYGVRTLPCTRDALLEDSKNHYGLSYDVLKEALGREGETAFVNIETLGNGTT